MITKEDLAFGKMINLWIPASAGMTLYRNILWSKQSFDGSIILDCTGSYGAISIIVPAQT